MAAKGFILAGFGLLAFFGLVQTPRAIALGLRRYLEKTFPGSSAKVHIGAGPFWFLSGHIDHIDVDLAHFNANEFPIPTGGSINLASNASEAAPGSAPDATQPEAAFNSPPSTENLSAGPVPTAGPPRTAPEAAPGGAIPDTGATRAAVVRWAHIGNIKVALKDFSFYGRRLRELQIELPDVRYDFGLARSRRMLKLGGSGLGQMLIRLSSEDLTDGAQLDRADIRSLAIHTEDDRIRVTLEYRTPLGWAPVSVTGQLELEEGRAIYFTHPAISAVNIPLPQPMTDFILKRVENLNPVFDLDRLELPMEVSLTGVTSTEAGLVVRGTVRIPQE